MHIKNMISADIKKAAIDELKQDPVAKAKYLLAKSIVSSYDALSLLEGEPLDNGSIFIDTLRTIIELFDGVYK